VVKKQVARFLASGRREKVGVYSSSSSATPSSSRSAFSISESSSSSVYSGTSSLKSPGNAGPFKPDASMVENQLPIYFQPVLFRICGLEPSGAVRERRRHDLVLPVDCPSVKLQEKSVLDSFFGIAHPSAHPISDGRFAVVCIPLVVILEFALAHSKLNEHPILSGNILKCLIFLKDACYEISKQVGCMVTFLRMVSTYNNLFAYAYASEFIIFAKKRKVWMYRKISYAVLESCIILVILKKEGHGVGLRLGVDRVF
jgi:hypothetical protein